MQDGNRKWFDVYRGRNDLIAFHSKSAELKTAYYFEIRLTYTRSIYPYHELGFQNDYHTYFLSANGCCQIQ